MIRKALLTTCIGYLLFSLSSCNSETWYKTPTGLTYRLISANSKGPASTTGCTVKVSYTVKMKDTVVGTTEGGMPVYQGIIPGIVNGYDAMEVFSYGLKEGDSVIVVQRIDSMVKKGLVQSIPKGMKGSDERITYMKVLKVFPPSYTAAGLKSDSLMNADKAAEKKKYDTKFIGISMKRLEKWLAAKNIQATNYHDSLFIQVLASGEGPKIDTGSSVTMDFNIRTTNSNQLINSTTDTAFHHAKPQTAIIGNHLMPLVMEEAVKGIGKGGHVIIYIPTILLFGTENHPQQIKPGDDIIADIEIRDIAAH